jgi:hypothetical protein
MPNGGVMMVDGMNLAGFFGVLKPDVHWHEYGLTTGIKIRFKRD